MTSPSRTISVRICHEDPLLAAGLRALIDQAPGLAADQGQVDSGYPMDVVVADYASGLALLGGAGPAGVPAARPPATRTIVVTRRAREAEVLRMLQLGAHGYLLQSSDPRELIDAIRHVAHGGARYLCRSATALVSNSPPSTRLTTREEDVLRLLVRGDCNKGIARQLAISANTVKAHVSAICFKLHASTRAQVAIKATDRGLVQSAA
ncbi:response regulator transcription factor [Pseudorhodoferax sp.]|jgi:DNA-binding NarL/FixJ family response regulator|uniref:response regulator transcription factor n=1 Tax=Pseudorhodoferax sp. TaxID=1993553 RepID=UPI002DD68C23|nr:response regulator transcription factor [Pseudorhodoferax sp.]